MDLSTGQRRALAIATVAPFVYWPALLASSALTGAIARTLPQPTMTPATYLFFALIALAPFVSIDMIVLTVVYVILAARAAKRGSHTAWIFAVILFGIFGQAAFYLSVLSPRSAAVVDATSSGPDSFDSWSTAEPPLSEQAPQPDAPEVGAQ